MTAATFAKVYHMLLLNLILLENLVNVISIISSRFAF